MASRSNLEYSQRAEAHSNPVVKRLFRIAQSKKTNLVVSADLTDSQSLLKCADELGPYIAVLKTHVDLVEDFNNDTIHNLKLLAKKHNFMIFEDRKLVDIGSTVQKQYHGGVLRISEWADIVNVSILGGDGILEALTQTVTQPDFPFRGERGFLILAEMTSKGSLATGPYTDKAIELARKHPESTIGYLATRALKEYASESNPSEDFVVFTTGINMATKGDTLGQQYQTPEHAVSHGADFIIAGRGIYGAQDPTEAAKAYRQEAWNAYLARLKSLED